MCVWSLLQYLQLLVELAELQGGGTSHLSAQVALHAVELAAPQLLELQAQLLHPQHCRLQLRLLLLEQAADLLDLCRCGTTRSRVSLTNFFSYFTSPVIGNHRGTH